MASGGLKRQALDHALSADTRKEVIMNLFWSTRALTQAREDHLTEFFAAALTLNEGFRLAYSKLVLDAYANQCGWDRPRITSVETQISYVESKCRPDMRITLDDGHIILCEHKLEAGETKRSESDAPFQLRRYLCLPVDGLVYVRSTWKPTAEDVLGNPRYIKPDGKEHFLWRDFYPILASYQDQFTRWLREGFELLGFTPPHPTMGDLEDRDVKKRRKNRKNFAKMWNDTKALAGDLGWKVGTGSIVELYLSNNPRSLVEDVFISPAKFERFLFRVTPRMGNIDKALRSLENAAKFLNIPVEVEMAVVPRKEGKVEVVEVKSTLRNVVGSEPKKPEEIEKNLREFIRPFLHALIPNS